MFSTGNGKYKTVIVTFSNTIFTFKFTKISFAIGTYIVIPTGIKSFDN